MLNIAICDDENSFCADLEMCLLKINSKYNVDVYYSGEDLCRKIEEGWGYDVIFLDIEMGAFNGIKTGQYIRQNIQDYLVQIVYVSAKSSYAMELFEINPLHFLIKPLNYEVVNKVIKRAENLMYNGNSAFMYKKNANIYKKPIKEILYFANQNRKIVIADINNDVDEFYGKLEEVLKRLPNTFIQVHKSYIINYNLATRIAYEEVTMKNGIRIPISQSKRSDIRQRIAELDKDNIIFG